MAILDKDQLFKFIYNPSLIQKVIMDNIESYTNKKNIVSDPTNPFSMLIEASCINTANAIEECNGLLRKKYRDLSTGMNDITHYINEDNVVNIFSNPSEAILDFHIDIVELKQKGYRNNGFIETTIPKYTVITVLDTKFTTFNDIVIRLYDNGNIQVLYLTNKIDILAYDNIYVLPNQLTHSSNGQTWITFRTKVKQIERLIYSDTLISSSGFNKTIHFNNKYHMSSAYIGNGEHRQTLTNIYSDEFISANNPSIYTYVQDELVTFKIPELYMVQGLSGILTIEIYTTKGKLYLPINKYSVDYYTIELGDSYNESSASSENITIVCDSQFTLDGGSDSMDFNTLKKYLIYGGNVKENIPITEEQISTIGSLNGYSISIAENSITHRLYTAYKALPKIENDLLNTELTIFFNTVVIDNLTTSKNILNLGNKIIIKHNSILEYTNGIIRILPDIDNRIIENIAIGKEKELLSIIKNKYLFYNPYLYVLDNNEYSVNITGYDFNRPSIDNYNILDTNNNSALSLNINQYDISINSNKIVLLFTLTNMDHVDDLELIAKVPIYGSRLFKYFRSELVYIQDNPYFKITLETDYHINDNTIKITNGIAKLNTTYIELNPAMYIYTVYRDDSITNDFYLKDDITVDELRNSIEYYTSIIIKEKLQLTLGKKLDNLYTNIQTAYSKRKYKQYTEDKVLLYKDTVYREDILDIQDNNVVLDIEHNKGDIVYKDSNPVYEFRKGDVVLDEYGNPVIDNELGIVRYIDMLLIDLKYLLAADSSIGTVSGRNYLSFVYDNLDKYINIDMESVNSRLLDNTSIKYKTNKRFDIKNIGNPVVTLYVEKKIDTSIYRGGINNIISKYLDSKEINIGMIKKDIENYLIGIVKAVTVNLLEDNKEIIKLDKEELFLNSKIILTPDNKIMIDYSTVINTVVV